MELYQWVWSITVTKHHPLLVLLVDVIIWCDLTRLMCTNTQVIQLDISCHHRIRTTTLIAAKTLTCK